MSQVVTQSSTQSNHLAQAARMYPLGNTCQAMTPHYGLWSSSPPIFNDTNDTTPQSVCSRLPLAADADCARRGRVAHESWHCKAAEMTTDCARSRRRARLHCRAVADSAYDGRAPYVLHGPRQTCAAPWLHVPINGPACLHWLHSCTTHTPHRICATMTIRKGRPEQQPFTLCKCPVCRHRRGSSSTTPSASAITREPWPVHCSPAVSPPVRPYMMH